MRSPAIDHPLLSTHHASRVRRYLGGAALRALAVSIAAGTLMFLVRPSPLLAQETPHIILASTTSTENSGLLDYLLPLFKQHSGIQVRVVAKGTGQAIKLAKNGDADVLLVHYRPSELKLVAEGHAVERREVMYNDYVLVGPLADPAGVKGGKDAPAALALIASSGENTARSGANTASSGAVFASRGDESGTHKAELGLWKLAGIDAGRASGRWYRETGSGMGATLNIAAGMNAYALTDRGTWLSFKNRQSLVLLMQGDPRLFNQYGVMLVNPARHPHVKAREGRAFIRWLTSPPGQQAIATFRLQGEQAFFPNYQP